MVGMNVGFRLFVTNRLSLSEAKKVLFLFSFPFLFFPFLPSPSFPFLSLSFLFSFLFQLSPPPPPQAYPGWSAEQKRIFERSFAAHCVILYVLGVDKFPSRGCWVDDKGSMYRTDFFDLGLKPFRVSILFLFSFGLDNPYLFSLHSFQISKQEQHLLL